MLLVQYVFVFSCFTFTSLTRDFAVCFARLCRTARPWRLGPFRPLEEPILHGRGAVFGEAQRAEALRGRDASQARREATISSPVQLAGGARRGERKGIAVRWLPLAHGNGKSHPIESSLGVKSAVGKQKAQSYRCRATSFMYEYYVGKSITKKKIYI